MHSKWDSPWPWIESHRFSIWDLLKTGKVFLNSPEDVGGHLGQALPNQILAAAIGLDLIHSYRFQSSMSIMSSGVTLWPHPMHILHRLSSKRCIKARSESSNDIKSWTKTPWRTASGAIELPVATLQFFCWRFPPFSEGNRLLTPNLDFIFTDFDIFWQSVFGKDPLLQLVVTKCYTCALHNVARIDTLWYFYTTCKYKYSVYILSYTIIYTIIQNNRNTHCFQVLNFGFPVFAACHLSFGCLPLYSCYPARRRALQGLKEWQDRQLRQLWAKKMQKSSNAQSWFSWCGK